MTEKELLLKLNSLKNVKPDAEWLNSNRELFLTQIANSGGQKLNVWQVFVINFKSLAKASSQPAFALGIFLFVLVASSIFGHKMFSQAKPNDSLYIARVISEKVKLNTVLDSQERDKMAVKFATNHAKDISAVLADPEFNNEENKDQVAKLSENFNKEIDTVKTKMVTIASRQPVQKDEENVFETATSVDLAASSSDDVFSIASETEISEIGIKVSEALEVTEIPVIPAIPARGEEGTTTPADPSELVQSVAAEAATTSSGMPFLDEAKELFDKKEYNNVIDKLSEVDELIK